MKCTGIRKTETMNFLAVNTGVIHYISAQYFSEESCCGAHSTQKFVILIPEYLFTADANHFLTKPFHRRDANRHKLCSFISLNTNFKSKPFN